MRGRTKKKWKLIEKVKSTKSSRNGGQSRERKVDETRGKIENTTQQAGLQEGLQLRAREREREKCSEEREKERERERVKGRGEAGKRRGRQTGKGRREWSSGRPIRWSFLLSLPVESSRVTREVVMSFNWPFECPVDCTAAQVDLFFKLEAFVTVS